MVRATGMLNDIIIYPIGFLYLMIMTMISSAHEKIITAWRKLPLDSSQWCKLLAVSTILAVVIAAIEIQCHAWDDSELADNGAEAVPKWSGMLERMNTSIEG